MKMNAEIVLFTIICIKYWANIIQQKRQFNKCIKNLSNTVSSNKIRKPFIIRSRSLLQLFVFINAFDQNEK